jgi:hypothetical protein
MSDFFKTNDLMWQSNFLSKNIASEKFVKLTKNFPTANITCSDREPFAFIDNDRSFECWIIKIEFKNKADEVEFIMKEINK